MSVDVSRLAIEVTTTGIKEASTALGGLSRAAGTTDTRVTSLTANLAKLMMAGGNVVGQMSGLTGVMALINANMQTAAATAATLVGSLGQVTQGMNNMTGSVRQASAALKDHSEWGGVVKTTLKAMATAAVAYFGVNFVKHSIEAADSWAMMAAKLNIATGSMNNAKVAQQDLFEMSQKLRIPMDDSIRLFTRLAPIMRQNGQSYESTKNMVEGLGLALKLGGATAQESASTMLQFSQAMQKGKLDGQEFNAVASNGKLVMDALSAATGRTQAELAVLRSKGFITPEIMMRALNQALPKWREQFKLLPVTVEDAVTRIKNSWTKAMGELSTETGMNAGLASTLGMVEGMIPAVRDELVKAFITVGTWINENKDGIGQIWDQVKGLGKDVFNIAGMFSSVLGQIFGVNKETNIFGLLLFTARLGLAGVVDIVKVVASSFVLAGADVADFFLTPIYFVVKSVDELAHGVGGVMKLLAAGADAAGMHGFAKMFGDAAAGSESLSNGAADLAKNIDQATAGAREMAASWTKGMSEGHTELQKVLDGETEVNLAIEKRAKLDKGAWGKDGKFPTPKDPKAAKEAEKQQKKAQDDLQRQIDLYKELSLQSKMIDQFGLSYDKLTKGQKDAIVLEDLLGRTTDDTAKKTLRAAIAKAYANDALERNNKLKISALEAEKKFSDTQASGIDAAQKELDNVNAQIDAYGHLKGATEDAALTEAKLQMLRLGDSSTKEQIDQMQAVIDKLTEVGEKKKILAGMELEDKLDKWFDESKVADFGNGFADAFGKAGKAIDKAGKSMDQYRKKMGDNETRRKEIAKLAEKDQLKAGYETDRLNKKELNDTLDYYADMAGAVKGFFKEKTVAYKVFDALEKGLRIARLAQDAEEFAVKIAQGWAWITAKITQATMAMAVDDKQSLNSQLNDAASGEASLAAGIAKCFAQMGIWGFVGAAAIVAFMAAWGFGGHGGGSTPNLKEDRQKANGTGTVLGDEAAKSDSLAKSMELLANKYNMGLEYTSRMLSYLHSINDGISSMASGVVSLNGVRGTTADQFKAGVGSSKGALGFSSSSTDMTDSGLQFDPNQTVGGVMHNGANVQGYYDLHNTSSSFWGLSKSSSNSHVNTAVDDAFKGQVTATIGDMVNLTETAAKGLGVADKGLTDTISNMKLGIDMVSLKDLSGDDLTNALNAAFSKLGDEMASAVIDPNLLKQFQKVGEGSLQTLVRLSSGLENATMLMGNLGIQVAGFNDIANKHGDIDAELVRASIDAKEAGTNVGKFIEEVNGSAEDIVAAYKSLVDIRSTLKAMGAGNDVSRALINGAGGLDALSSGLGDFVSNFYDDSKKAAIGLSKLRDQFNALGVQMPATKDGFRSLVESLLAGDDASKTMAGRVMGLSSAFSDAMDAVDSAVSSKKDALKTAYDDQSSALQDTITKMQDFVKTMGDFKQSLMLGDLSTQNALEKYQTAKKVYEDTYSKAVAGDQDAMDKFQDVANTFLQNSRAVYASGDAYTQDYKTVIDAIDAVTGAAQGKGSTAQTQLDAMKAQVGALIDLTDKVTTVTQAIIDLNAALTGVNAPTTAAVTQVVTVPTQIGPLNGTTLDGSDAIDNMLNAANAAFQGTQTATTTSPNAAATTNPTGTIGSTLRTLVEEVTKLRAEQAQQTGDMIAATYDSNEQNAQTVVAGTTQAAQDAAYAQTVQTGLN